MYIDKFDVEEWMNEFENDSKYNIAETCVESLTLSELLEIDGSKEEFMSKLSDMKLTYGAIPGTEELRDEITKLYHTKKNINNVLITNGGIGANFLALFTLLSPGDEVVALYPTYQQLYSLPQAFGAKVHRLRLSAEDNFLPNMDKLRTIVSHKTKAIIINTPNNPTGACFGKEIMTEIAKIADNVGAWVLCDEIYRGLEHEESYSIPSITDIYEKGIGTSSVSKVYSLAGLRLGWITASEHFIKDCFSHRDYNTISCGMIDDALALVALKNKTKITERNLNILRENKKILMSWIEKTAGMSLIEPKAGTTALVKYDYHIDSKDFCRRLFEYNGAFIVPGSCFEFENHLRIGYAQKKEVLVSGLNAITDFIKTL
ncbi:MAG: aminotransferase [Synergistaceae bacterium]